MIGKDFEGVTEGGIGGDEWKLSAEKVVGDDDLRELGRVQVILDVVQRNRADETAVFVRKRLLPPRKIDDRKATMDERDVPAVVRAVPNAVAIRSAMYLPDVSVSRVRMSETVRTAMLTGTNARSMSRVLQDHEFSANYALRQKVSAAGRCALTRCVLSWPHEGGTHHGDSED